MEIILSDWIQLSFYSCLIFSLETDKQGLKSQFPNPCTVAFKLCSFWPCVCVYVCERSVKDDNLLRAHTHTHTHLSSTFPTLFAHGNQYDVWMRKRWMSIDMQRNKVKYFFAVCLVFFLLLLLILCLVYRNWWLWIYILVDQTDWFANFHQIHTFCLISLSFSLWENWLKDCVFFHPIAMCWTINRKNYFVISVDWNFSYRVCSFELHVNKKVFCSSLVQMMKAIHFLHLKGYTKLSGQAAHFIKFSRMSYILGKNFLLHCKRILSFIEWIKLRDCKI